MQRLRPPWDLIGAQLGILGLGLLGALLIGALTQSSVILALVLLIPSAAIALAALTGLEHLKLTRLSRAAAESLGRSDDLPTSHAERIRQLTDSRRRIVDAFEIERSRIERDLHDGAQQFLVAASLKVGEAAMSLDQVTADHPQDQAVRTASDLLAQAQDDTATALAALRETVAGVHSRLLAEQGLEPALRELAARFSRGDREVTLRIPHPLPDLPQGVASAAWFFAAEALTNATKYAPTAPVSVVVAADRTLHVTVVDEGPGGADFAPGHGLAGMRERLSAFGGTMTITSPVGGPTSVSARIPLLLEPAGSVDEEA